LTTDPTDPTRDHHDDPPLTGQVVASRDTHYEATLDDPDDEPTPDRAPVYVDVVSREHEYRPIIPAALRGKANVTANAKRAAGRTGHRALYHGVRLLPRYVPLALFWAVVGVFRLAGWQLRWWWVAEQHELRQQAAADNDPAAWLRLHTEAKATRAWRGIVLATEVVALVTGGVLLATIAPWWVGAAVVLAVMPWLAHVGRPVGRPIVTPAVVTPRFRKLTGDIVLRAYYAAKLGDPDKPGQQIQFGSVMSRDGEGSRVLVDLPYGRGLTEAVAAREKIASGLDVAVSQVFIHRDPSSHRRHVLWVADRDPLAIPAGRTPLLRCAPTDIWTPAPFGLDERGNRVTVPMLWHSIMVGAQPRQGKSWSSRALALYAALDPYVKLTVFDPSGKPDWRKFALVADRCGFGLAMTRDGDPAELLIDALREIKADVQDRYERLSQLPVDVCPEGKLTREIARDPRYRMPVRLVVLDEFQEWFDLGDISKEIAGLLVYLVKVAPAAGVILLDATQRPSGVGTGQVGQQFISFRDNHQIRFSLRTGSWQVSDLVLGAGAYSEGYDSSTLLPEYKGVGILRGASDATPTVRTHLADAEDTERILLAARRHREAAGTLSGAAAGEEIARQVRDVLADVRGAYFAGEAFVSWQQLAARLAEQLPEAYADLNPETISAQVRAFGVPSVNGKRDGQVLKGAKAADVDAAIHRRAITAG
jgi:DNA segregation ATPase FtsK/SpoIIIE, S-DNA-T family